MKAFIVYPTYRIINSKAYIYLFGRLENGESFLTKTLFRPYFYIKEADRKKTDEIETDIKYDIEQTDALDFRDNKLIKIILNLPKEVPLLRKLMEEIGIACYEADIRFAYRYLIDNDLMPIINIEGDYEENMDIHVDRFYNEPKITPAMKEGDIIEFKDIPELKILSIDIESDDKDNLLAVSFYSKDYKRSILVKKDSKEYKDTIAAEDEKSAIIEFQRIIMEFDPDVIVGWNFIDFDLKFLYEKFRKYKIPFVLGRTEDPSRLKIESSFIRDSSIDIAGRMVLDGIHVLKSSFVKLDDYKLETAAQHFLGKGKLLKGEDRHKDIIRLYEEDTQKLLDYNMKDSVLVYDILMKSGTYELTVQRSLLTGMTLERVRASVASLDSLYLRSLKKINRVAYSSQYYQKDRAAIGGYVRDSKPGIYDYVIVCDFKSLYPSIITTFNIDPMHFLGVDEHKKTDKEIVVAPNGAYFRNDKGILPQIIQRLWKQRDNAKKQNNQLASYAIKIHMNSFYGVLGNPACRFYSYDVTGAITHFGQMLIKLAAEKVKENGFEVIYGDTDSIFIDLKVNNFEEAEKQGNIIQNYINNFFKEYVKDNYYRENRLELEFEKVYEKFIMPYSREKDKGAKKRYAGLKVEKKDREFKKKVDIVGLEFVRRDWTDLSKKYQMSIIERVFEGKEIIKFTNNFIKDLKDGKYDELLIYRKAIRKDIDEYTKTTPPHIKAARLLEAQGISLKSNIIRYIITTNGPEPIADGYNTGQIDYDHYIEKQIKPLADSILVFFDQNFDDVIAGSSQSNLFDF